MTQSLKIPLIILAIGALFAVSLVALRPDPVAHASVPMGGEYQGTTTQSAAGSFAAEALLQTGGGALGSVVVTGATTGTISIYDATTSDSTKRTGQTASTSLLLASFPASAAAGTYTFDRLYFRGLLIEITGTTPTSTITFR